MALHFQLDERLLFIWPHLMFHADTQPEEADGGRSRSPLLRRIPAADHAEQWLEGLVRDYTTRARGGDHVVRNGARHLFSIFSQIPCR